MRKLMVVALMAALGGCSTAFKEGIDAKVASDEQKMRSMHRAAQPKSEPAPVVVVSDGIYIGRGVRVPLPKESALPAIFSKEVTLVESRALTLPEIAQRITQITGVGVGLPQEARQTSGATASSASTLDSIIEASRVSMRVRYTGTVTGLLDTVATHFGVHWEFEKGMVSLYKLKSRTFSLAALPGKISAKQTVSNKSSTSSSSGGASTSDASSEGEQSMTMEHEASAWDDAIGALKGILSKDGQVIANPSAGTITVTDTPAVLSMAEQVISEFNRNMTRQVALVAKVYTLTLEDSQNFAFSLDAVFRKLSQEYEFSVSGTPAFDAGGLGGMLNAAILDTGSPSGKWAEWVGTTAFAQALRSYGKLSLVTSGSGITLNNQTLPIQNISRVGYVASTAVTSTSDTGATTTELTPGQVTVGFSMTVTPHIQSNGDVMLQYGITLSSLDNMRTVTAGSSMIQMPEVSTRTFMQRVAVKSGSTLVLAGFEQDSAGSDSRRGMLGYAENSSDQKTLVIVTITVNALGAKAAG